MYTEAILLSWCMLHAIYATSDILFLEDIMRNLQRKYQLYIDNNDEI